MSDSDVIEEELLFPVGTHVVCKAGTYKDKLDSEKGGAGFQPGKQFVVHRVTTSSTGHYILWLREGHGIYQYAVELDGLGGIIDIINKELNGNI